MNVIIIDTLIVECYTHIYHDSALAFSARIVLIRFKIDDVVVSTIT